MERLFGRFCLLMLAIAVLLTATFGDPVMKNAQAQTLDTSTGMLFEIPGQPLASALDAYSAVTGQEVFYDGALVLGHSSNGVSGRFSADAALQILLAGTGLVPHVTGPRRFSITHAAQTVVNTDESLAASAGSDAYERYFAEIQANLRRTFCRNPRTQPGGYELVVKFWMGPSGAVQRSELLGSTGDRSRDSAFKAVLRTMNIGKPPPVGMPQPVTMAVLPRLDSTRECSSDVREAD